MEISSSKSPKIVVQNLQMQIPVGIQKNTKELLIGEIDDLKIEHLSYAGPIKQTIHLLDGYVTMFLFLNGNGLLHADSRTYQLSPESIAIPKKETEFVQLEIAENEVLHVLQFAKKISLQDLEDLRHFPEENKYPLFFTRFEDCEPYTEKIKSPNTISRTVLPADIVPRVSLGTVEAIGPDKVGAHSHPMLEQLFLGLSDNNITVYADDASTEFKEYALLHIPLGSNHWVSVKEGKKMNYMWMDFFLTKEGQEWLLTHKPIKSEHTQ